MRRFITASRAATLATGLAAAATLTACAPPPGRDSGRVGVTETTRAERDSAQILPTALVEFSDQVASQLAEDLQDLPELNAGYRSTVVFGDIVNKTGIVSTTEFEAFRTRIRQDLLQSRAVRDKMRFIESRARLEDLKRREGNQNRDLLQDGSRNTRPDLNEDYTYFLNGEMYRVSRGNDRTNLYMLSFNLMRMSDGEIVWTNSPYEIKQAR